MIRKVQILQQGISEEYFSVVKAIATRKLKERAGVSVCAEENAFRLTFMKNTALAGESYRILPEGSGVRIEANSPSALLCGFGSFLRGSELRPAQGMLPMEKEEDHTFDQPFRGMYFASHNHNFYEDAPMEEIRLILEDLALWGLNVIMVWFDMSQQFPTDRPETVRFLARLKEIFLEAKRIGIQTAFTSNSNEAFPDSPEELRAEWKPQGKYFAEIIGHYHIELCPSKKGGMERILSDRRKYLELIKDFPLDFFLTGPYDQGGCTCEKCAPYGANGYLRTCRALYPLVKEYFPEIRFCISTWYFEHFVPGEWEAFRKEMEAGDYRDWITYVIGFFDIGEHVPEFLREGNGIAGIPMVEFSEISMYGAKPWGGFGANPMTKKFSAIREHTAGVFRGCVPYSEGAYEDVNKVMVLSQAGGLCRDGFEANYQYARLEFSPDLAGDIAKLLQCLDEGLLRVRMDDEAEVPGTVSVRFGIYFIKYIDYARELADRIDAQLDQDTRKGWKWRIIYLRAQIDYELYHSNWYMNAKTVGYMNELIRLYHAEKANYYVCPPTPEALRRNGVNFLGQIDPEQERTQLNLGEQGKNG